MCILYIRSVHLQDLVFIEEGNNDKITVGEKQLINFGKYRLMFEVISSNVLQLQKV